MDVTVCDVGPRDGLQNERRVLDPALRVELIRKLAGAGVPRVEAASFVNPELVPAMGGAKEVMAELAGSAGASYTALVLNIRGYERATAAGARELRYGFSVTDGFGLRNQNQTTAQGLEIARALVARAHSENRSIGVTLSVAFGCPFAGRVSKARVLGLVEQLMEDPPDEIQVADTIGVGVPTQVRSIVAAMVASGAPTGAHFHNTRNTGIANAVAALESGAATLDASIGGLGGCPFAPRATGNVATEDLVYALEEMGVRTGIDLERLIEVSHWLAGVLETELPSMVAQAGPFPSGARAARS